MRNILGLATLLVLGCNSPASQGLSANDTPMCSTPDGGVCSGVPGAQGEQGPAGPQGAVGPVGPAGATGPAGAQGPAGVSNVPGPQGPAGATGPAGPQGPQGVQGIQGPQGAQGSAGPQGAQGQAIWLSTNVTGTSAVIGMLTPLSNGPGIFLTEAKGSTGISNFPEGMVISQKASTVYYDGLNCAGNPGISQFDYPLTNQLYWQGNPGAGGMYQLASPINWVSGRSYFDGSICQNGGALMAVLQPSAYTFNPYAVTHATLTASLQ